MTYFASFNGCIMRATRIDGTGLWIPGAETSVVSEGFISVSSDPNVDEGAQWRQRRLDGTYAPLAEDLSQVEGIEVDISFLRVEPAVAVLLGAARGVYDWDDNLVGVSTTYRQSEAIRFALEVWSLNPPTDSCGTPTWVYWLLAMMTDGVSGPVTLEHGEASFSYRAKAGQNPVWAAGPYDVVEIDGIGTAGPLPDPLTSADLQYTRPTTIAPPSSVVGFVTVP